MQNKLLILVFALALSATTSATLFDRGNGLIYDDTLDITWQQNAGGGVYLNVNDSIDWADTLSFGGYNDWRLPTLNELGAMYGTLGGTGDLTGDQGLIQNIQGFHWSSTEHGSNAALGFDFRNGFGVVVLPGHSGSAWAVRPGDASIVPLPGAVWLLASGLLGLAGWRRNVNSVCHVGKPSS